MGDPKRIRKKYKTPRQPFEKDRIQDELQTIGKYGLRNRKEIWKNSTLLRHFRGNARRLLSLEPEDREIGERELLGRLQRMGLIDKKSTLDDVLSLQIENFLDRRLQTIIHKKGMATTPHHSRQLIVHGHIIVGDRVVNSPSYFVTPEEEKMINFASSSPLSKPSHKALPANVYKKKEQEEKTKGKKRAPSKGKKKPSSKGKPKGKPKDSTKGKIEAVKVKSKKVDKEDLDEGDEVKAIPIVDEDDKIDDAKEDKKDTKKGDKK